MRSVNAAERAGLPELQTQAPEVAEFPLMGGVTLRKALTAALQRDISDTEFWSAAATRARKIAKDVKYWDAVTILQTFAAVGNKSHVKCFLALAESIEQQLSQMAPKHIFDCIAAFEALGHRPKSLYTGLFLTLQRLVPSMYSEEVAGMAAVLARHNIRHEKLLDNLATKIIEHRENIRVIDFCQIAGSFASLGFADQAFFERTHC